MPNDGEIDDNKERAREVLRGWYDKRVAQMPPEVVAQAEAYLGVWFKAWDELSLLLG